MILIGNTLASGVLMESEGEEVCMVASFGSLVGSRGINIEQEQLYEEWNE